MPTGPTGPGPNKPHQMNGHNRIQPMNGPIRIRGPTGPNKSIGPTRLRTQQMNPLEWTQQSKGPNRAQQMNPLEWAQGPLHSRPLS